MSKGEDNSRVNLSDKSSSISTRATADARSSQKLSKGDTPETDFFENRINQLVEKGKKRGRRYSKIGIIASLLISISVIIGGRFLMQEINRYSQEAEERAKKTSEMSSQTENKAAMHNSWKTCEFNSDCVATRKDCCACQAGGEQTAINFKFLDEWESLLDKKCKDVICPQVYKCQTSSADCRNEKCIFTANPATSTVESDI